MFLPPLVGRTDALLILASDHRHAIWHAHATRESVWSADPDCTMFASDPAVGSIDILWRQRRPRPSLIADGHLPTPQAERTGGQSVGTSPEREQGMSDWVSCMISPEVLTRVVVTDAPGSCACGSAHPACHGTGLNLQSLHRRNWRSLRDGMVTVLVKECGPDAVALVHGRFPTARCLYPTAR